ncbi:MAG: cytochrome c [Bauldia sp.]|nr:cytochrome c [Bauldia sp.]
MKRFATSVSFALVLGLATAAGAAGIVSGAETTPASAPPVQLAQLTPDDPAAVASAIELATPLFRRNCSSCHGNAGEGGIGPRLAGSTKMESQTLIINQVLFGSEYMPPFAEMLSDEEVAAIATFVRNSWGNAYPLVTVEAVAELRGPAR